MPWLNQITTCSDLASCFQAIYNLGIVVLFSLAFLNMVYGALELQVKNLEKIGL